MATEPEAEERLIECPGCKQELPESAYYRGRLYKCRECIKGQYRQWNAEHQAQRKASRAARLDRIARGEPSNLRYPGRNGNGQEP